MPEQRNYRFADDIPVGDLSDVAKGAAMPSSIERAKSDAVWDVLKDPAKSIGNIIEQARQIASNKQKLISTIIKPMTGLDDKPATAGTPSPAEVYADKILSQIESISSISEDAAIAMILEVWPVWQSKGHTWNTFFKFIINASYVFSNPQDVIEWSKKLFESMQDGAPVFTPEYIMSVALDALKTKNFTNYQNLLISLPFYKSVWSKQPIDTSGFSKAVSQISTMMEAVRTPTQEMSIVLRNMTERNRLITAMSSFYKSLLTWVVEQDTQQLFEVANSIRNKTFKPLGLFETLARVEMKKRILRQSIGDAIRGLNVVNPQRPMEKHNSNKLFKTVLAVVAPAGAPVAGSGTSGSTTTTTGSGMLTPLEQDAINSANLINRKKLMIDKRKSVIEKYLTQIGNISEQKAKGLSGDLGLFSSLVTSGNVIEKIDKTITEIGIQYTEIMLVIAESKKWMDKYKDQTDSNAIRAQIDSISMLEMEFKAYLQDLSEIKQSLKIQRIVLPKELEYFELKQDYDTNVEQLKAPVSALMVNTLVTTRDSRTGKLTTVNKRVTRPLAIKSVWETGKQIVNLLMNISQTLQSSADNSALGQSMFKNATNYYKAAIKQEVENNTMLMNNLTSVGLGQVNYTPVPVGKKEGR